jgi:ribonuclease-3 family protein
MVINMLNNEVNNMAGIMENAKLLNAQTLAFVGDSVYDLLVRQHLVQNNTDKVCILHDKAVKYVCCRSQSASIKKILSLLNDEEMKVFKRGRNANTVHQPRSATPIEYHNATGLEALFGYLYLEGKNKRIRELFDIIVANL